MSMLCFFFGGGVTGKSGEVASVFSNCALAANEILPASPDYCVRQIGRGMLYCIGKGRKACCYNLQNSKNKVFI